MTKTLRTAKGLSWKYWLRITIAPVLARIGRLSGFGWIRLGSKFGREVLIGQLRAAPQIVDVPTEASQLDVVFLTMMGGNQRLCSTEVVLGRALAARGHRVRYVLCDQQLPACEVKATQRESTWAASCAKCYEFGKQLLSATDCEVIPASEMLSEIDERDEWSSYVESALLKHYRVGVLGDQPDLAIRRSEFAESAKRSAAIGRGVAKMQPDRVIMSHGIYCTWGPAREVLNEAGVPLVTYAEGKRKDTIKFNWTTSADWWDVSKEWQTVRSIPLTANEASSIDDYLTSRRDHSRDNLQYNFGDEESLTATRQRLSLDDKPTFVLFTNVLWDAASAQREIVFDNPVQWVLETISWFAQHPDKQLVVKIHPAEVVIGTKQPFATIIDQHFSELPNNVRVIKPDENVNSWSIMRVADLGLVHTSTIGMELPLEGIPCAVVSKTHFRSKGFTIDVENKEGYFELLDTFSPSIVDRDQLKTLSKRYAYLLFERYQLPFPFLTGLSTNDVRAFSRLSQRELLNDPTMALFANALESGEDFLHTYESVDD